MALKLPPLKDVDSADQAQRLHAAGWTAMGAVVPAMLGYLFLGITGFLVGYVIGFLFIYFVALRIASGAGSAAASIYMSDGASTPKTRAYAIGDALAMQGKYEEAADEFERNAVVYPDDPEPRMRAARLCRDRMQQYERAAGWFKQILAMPDLDVGYEIQSSRELAEMYSHRLKQPERALPILARLAERHPDTTAGKWARAEMSE